MWKREGNQGNEIQNHLMKNIYFICRFLINGSVYHVTIFFFHFLQFLSSVLLVKKTESIVLLILSIVVIFCMHHSLVSTDKEDLSAMFSPSQGGLAPPPGAPFLTSSVSLAHWSTCARAHISSYSVKHGLNGNV